VDDQVRALRALLQTSEAQRAAAENRADQAVAYAQQTQAELHQREAAFTAQVQALEARARTLANEAQDWQIRHREAETQVAELAQSVASTEARFSELRSERDELLAALEEATSPDGATARDEEPAEQA
jgi:chromosome segregation ATPase